MAKQETQTKPADTPKTANGAADEPETLTDPRSRPGFKDLPKPLQSAQVARYEKAVAKAAMSDRDRAKYEVQGAVRNAAEALSTGRNNLRNVAMRYRKALTDSEAQKAAEYILEQAQEAADALVGATAEVKDGFTL